MSSQGTFADNDGYGNGAAAMAGYSFYFGRAE